MSLWGFMHSLLQNRRLPHRLQQMRDGLPHGNSPPVRSHAGLSQHSGFRLMDSSSHQSTSYSVTLNRPLSSSHPSTRAVRPLSADLDLMPVSITSHPTYSSIATSDIFPGVYEEWRERGTHDGRSAKFSTSADRLRNQAHRDRSGFEPSAAARARHFGSADVPAPDTRQSPG